MTFLLASVQIGAQTPFMPNDPYFQYQVPLHNTGQTIDDPDPLLPPHTGTPDADIDLPEAWFFTMGHESVVIAVIDDGVSPNHPDLPSSRLVQGWNMSDYSHNTTPVGNEAHGTAIAGVIAATANNGKGIAGVAPNCKIMPIVIDINTPRHIINAINQATICGVDVINLSVGVVNEGNDTYFLRDLESAIRNAINHGIVVVVAAGNTADHVSGGNGYVDMVASFDIPGLLVVGASDRYDLQSDYSPSSEYISVVAPSSRAVYPTTVGSSSHIVGIAGEYSDMWVTDIPGNAGYNPCNESGGGFSIGTTNPSSGTDYLAYSGRFGGTSYSCAIVSGVAALVKCAGFRHHVNGGVFNALSPQDICGIIKSTADKIGPYNYVNGRSLETGYGRINAEKAVWEAQKVSEIRNKLINYGRTEYCDDITIENSSVYGGELHLRNKGTIAVENYFYVGNNAVFEVKPFAWE